MLPFTIFAISLIALTTGAPQTWSTSHPDHIVIPSRGGRQLQPQNLQGQDSQGQGQGQDSEGQGEGRVFPPLPPLPVNAFQPTNTFIQPIHVNRNTSPNCPPPQSESQPEVANPNKTVIAWCTPLPASSGNASEPVVAWFTQIQPGDTAPPPTPPPSNSSTNGNATEGEAASEGDAKTKKSPATRELGTCTPINPDGNAPPMDPPKAGQIGWYVPIPTPDEVAAEESEELSPEELSEPGGNVTLGWCTPLIEGVDAAVAQLGDCRPYQPATPDAEASSTTSTTTTPKPTKDGGEGGKMKELLGWYTPLKIDPAAKGSVIAYFIPVVASVPPPKEPVTKDTKAGAAEGAEGGGDSAMMMKDDKTPPPSA